MSVIFNFVGSSLFPVPSAEIIGMLFAFANSIVDAYTGYEISDDSVENSEEE